MKITAALFTVLSALFCMSATSSTVSIPLPVHTLSFLVLEGDNDTAGTLTTFGDGPKVCNNTSSAGQVQLCHSTSVTLGASVGGISASTGQASSTCFSQSLAPQKCIFWHYEYSCQWTGWIFGWECGLTKMTVEECPI